MKVTRFGPVVVVGHSPSSTLMILVEGKADPSINNNCLHQGALLMFASVPRPSGS